MTTRIEKGMEVGDWTVDAVSDEDGHLNIYLKHRDGSQISCTSSDIGTDEEWGDRFTTEAIEKEYAKSLEDDQFLCVECLISNDIDDSIQKPHGLVCANCEDNKAIIQSTYGGHENVFVGENGIGKREKAKVFYPREQRLTRLTSGEKWIRIR